MKSKLTQMRNEEGFTLIELMIVLIVLGVLVGLILFAVDPFQDSAQKKVNESNADSCETARAAATATGSDVDEIAPGGNC